MSLFDDPYIADFKKQIDNGSWHDKDLMYALLRALECYKESSDHYRYIVEHPALNPYARDIRLHCECGRWVRIPKEPDEWTGEKALVTNNLCEGRIE